MEKKRNLFLFYFFERESEHMHEWWGGTKEEGERESLLHHQGRA